MVTAAAERSLSSVASVLRLAGELLRDSGSPSPRLDAEVLLAEALGRDRAWVLAHPEAPVPSDVRVGLDRWLARRASGEPIAYIRGVKEWLSLRIAVDHRVLIPRPETELLAEAAIDELRRRLDTGGPDRPIVAWEVGTGSGAVAVAIGLACREALEAGTLRLIASDNSPEALAVAAENLATHGLAGRIQPVVADLLGSEAALTRPDVVVANLPYIPSDEVDRLPVAASFEPRAALDGGPDGLDVLRRLIAQLADRLTTDGVALLELGAGQAGQVRELAAARRLEVERAMQDLAGVERVVRLVRRAA